MDPEEQDNIEAEWYEYERDANKTNCTKIDEAYTKLENFQISQLEVEKLSTVNEILKSRLDYNVTDESKQAIDFFFWIRPTAQWKCNAAEFKKTFDIIDEVAVQYEATRISRVFRPLYFFIGATFLFHLFFLLPLMTCSKNGASIYPPLRYWLMVYEVICLFLFVVFSQDALKGLEHIDQVKVVTQNFAGKCTDTLAQYDFNIDYGPYEEAAEKGRSLVMLPYFILPVYAIQLIWTFVILCRKK